MTKVLSFRTWCGIQEYFFFKQKEKSLDPQSSWGWQWSSFRGWQVTWFPIEDFEDDSGCVFEDDSGDVIPHTLLSVILATSVSFPRKRESRKYFFLQNRKKHEFKIETLRYNNFFFKHKQWSENMVSLIVDFRNYRKLK